MICSKQTPKLMESDLFVVLFLFLFSTMNFFIEVESIYGNSICYRLIVAFFNNNFCLFVFIVTLFWVVIP
jgi:hypothetical protein